MKLYWVPPAFRRVIEVLTVLSLTLREGWTTASASGLCGPIRLHQLPAAVTVCTSGLSHYIIPILRVRPGSSLSFNSSPWLPDWLGSFLLILLFLLPHGSSWSVPLAVSSFPPWPLQSRIVKGSIQDPLLSFQLGSLAKFSHLLRWIQWSSSPPRPGQISLHSWFVNPTVCSKCSQFWGRWDRWSCGEVPLAAAIPLPQLQGFPSLPSCYSLCFSLHMKALIL